jgi:hypothetical protein
VATGRVGPAGSDAVGQDLNGDGTIGLTKTVIQTDGSTSLTLVASQNYYFLNSSGSGPSLKYAGANVVAGQFGGWTPIGAVQTAGGYEVAWKVVGADEYTVWSTDSNGNALSNLIGVVSGTDAGLEAAELTFNQDLNGDGVMGPPTIAIGANERLELAGGYSGTISFAGSTGTLKIDNSSTFSGSIAGQLAIGDVIDLADVTAGGSAALAYSGNYSPGTLTVSDVTHTAHIGLLGNYSLANFTLSSDGHGGTSVIDPPLSPSPASAAVDDSMRDFANPALLTQYLGAFVGSVGGESASFTENHAGGLSQQSTLASPVP